MIERECERSSSVLHVCRSVTELWVGIAEAIVESGARRVLLAEAALLSEIAPPAAGGPVGRLAAEGIEIVRPRELTAQAREREASLAALAAAVDLAVTGGELLVAATGTLVLGPRASELETASLLPPLHHAVIPAERIIPDFETLCRLLAKGAVPGERVALVTGPSRTADIEKMLVMPAHGPKEIHLWVLDPAGLLDLDGSGSAR